jgi:hypothetical protein
MSSQPPSGFIHLILLSQENPFYLEIPTAIVGTLCLSPRKYLRYLGWCVLGAIGVLSDVQGNEIALHGELVDQGVYHYIVSDQDVLAHAVDLEVIKQRSQVPTETTETHEDFRAKVLERDGCCVWTSMQGVGMHIIPYSRGDEACSHYSYPGMRAKFSILLQWLRSIINNRPHDENLDSLTIDDIENGIYADNNIHSNHFDRRDVVVLKVCPLFFRAITTKHLIRRRILSSKPPTSQIGASAIYSRMSVTQPTPDIRFNGSLPRKTNLS